MLSVAGTESIVPGATSVLLDAVIVLEIRNGENPAGENLGGDTKGAGDSFISGSDDTV